MRKSLLFSLSLVAFLAIGNLAAAEEGPAGSAKLTASHPAPSFLSVSANAGTEKALGGNLICRLRRLQCEIGCAPQGVFEFSCDPATGQSSCICNIGP